MRIVRIYQAGNYSLGDEIVLSPQASAHLSLVLRLKKEAIITLFSGNNREYLSVITEIKKNQVYVTILNEKEVDRESSCQIHLAQGLSKSDKMEFVVQKAVELGVSSITPVITERTNIKLDEARILKKQQQWQAIAIAACEQSGRNKIPIIAPIQNLSEYLQTERPGLNFVLEPRAEKSWRDYSFESRPITLLIGPEGGFSSEEQASLKNFLPLCLGPRILRTETAALVGLSVLQALIGDL